MGTNSGSMHAKGWHAFHGMMAQAAENAMTKGLLNGRKLDGKKEIVPKRGAVIWPGKPEDVKLWAKLNPTAWSRWAIPEPGAIYGARPMVGLDIEARAA